MTNFANDDLETFKLIIDDKTITDYQDQVFDQDLQGVVVPTTGKDDWMLKGKIMPTKTHIKVPTDLKKDKVDDKDELKP